MRATVSTTSPIAAVVLAFLSGAVEAGEPTLRALPLHAISFDLGSKHAVSYFVVKDGNCELTVLLADLAGDDDIHQSPPARMTVPIAAKRTAIVSSPGGTAAEFACAANAEAMTVRLFKEVAFEKGRP